MTIEQPSEPHPKSSVLTNYNKPTYMSNMPEGRRREGKVLVEGSKYQGPIPF